MNIDRSSRSRLKPAGLAAAGVAAAVLAVAGVAHAATSSPSQSPSAGSSDAPAPATSAPATSAPADSGRSFDHGGSDPVRSDEKSVSDSITKKLTAAALKAVPGATVYRVETDAGDAKYEVHLTKSDGSLATAKFDKDLNLVKVEEGMGLGDPAPQGGRGPGGPGGHGDRGQVPDSPQSGSGSGSASPSA